MNDDIRLSVALLARNRPDSLRRCLESLRAQDVKPHEIVLSDDSATEHSAAVAVIAAQFGCRYVTGPQRGLYANRNFAASRCAGTHIRTMDDDHTFPPGHLAQCIAAIRSDPRAIWTTGEIGYVDGKLHGKSDTAPQLHPSGVGGPVANPDDNWAIADGSTIYPREIFDRGFRMVEDFGYGSSYLEFGAYLYARGYRSRCIPGAYVEHHATPETLVIKDLASCLFASLCFNLHFKRSLALAGKYILSYAVLRQPALLGSVPSLIEKARYRWTRDP